MGGKGRNGPVLEGPQKESLRTEHKSRDRIRAFEIHPERTRLAPIESR